MNYLHNTTIPIIIRYNWSISSPIAIFVSIYIYVSLSCICFSSLYMSLPNPCQPSSEVAIELVLKLSKTRLCYAKRSLGSNADSKGPNQPAQLLSAQIIIGYYTLCRQTTKTTNCASSPAVLNLYCSYLYRQYLISWHGPCRCCVMRKRALAYDILEELRHPRNIASSLRVS